MTAETPLPHPDENAVRQALNAVLTGKALRDSPQLRAFLTFVVNETLAGRADDIKGYSIATLALGRSDDFDPQTDPSVRVQAGRLRQALAEHYAETPESTIIIGLERGTYIPTFRFRNRSDLTTSHATSSAPTSIPAPPSNAAPVHSAAPTSRRKLLLIAGSLAAAGIGGALFWSRTSVRPSDRQLQTEAYFPVLWVNAEPAGTQDAVRIATRLQDAISRFDDLVVVGSPDNPDRVTGTTMRVRTGWDLQLNVTASPSGEGMIRPNLRLSNRQDQRLLWSREMEPLPAGQAGDRSVSSAIRTIAAAIAQPYGIIHAHFRERLAANKAPPDPFSCIVAALDYWLTNAREAHLEARNCVEGQLARFPNAGLLHAHLAYLHLEEFRQGYNPIPGDARRRALDSARKAVLYKPGSARAQQSLMATYFAVGDLAGAWRVGTEALAINPIDTEILADLGSYKVMAGEYEAGLAYLDQAIDLNPAPLAWAITYRAMALYLLGRLDISGPMVATLEGSDYVLAQVALIMAAFQFRDRPRGESSLAVLRKTHPDAAKDLPARLRIMNFQEPVIAKIIKDYDRAIAWLTDR